MRPPLRYTTSFGLLQLGSQKYMLELEFFGFHIFYRENGLACLENFSDLKSIAGTIVFNAVKVRPIHITCRDRKKEERIEVKNSALSARAAGESG